MKCRFCGHALSREMLRAIGCGACGGACRKIHCPYCGEENPLVDDEASGRKAEHGYRDKLFARKDKKGHNQ